jgi:hypothetical protein
MVDKNGKIGTKLYSEARKEVTEILLRKQENEKKKKEKLEKKCFPKLHKLTRWNKLFVW